MKALTASARPITADDAARTMMTVRQFVWCGPVAVVAGSSIQENHILSENTTA
jgi:hypothetical protein